MVCQQKSSNKGKQKPGDLETEIGPGPRPGGGRAGKESAGNAADLLGQEAGVATGTIRIPASPSNGTRIVFFSITALISSHFALASRNCAEDWS